MDLTKMLLIGGGAFIVYEMFLKPQTAVATTGGTTATTQNTTNATQGSVSTQQPSNTAVANQTLQAVLNAMVAAGEDPTKYHSVDTWNFYYQLIRGIPGPAPEQLFPNNPRTQTYSIGEWWAAMTGAGLSGIGAIAFRNPYQNPVKGLYFGSNMRATGFEKADVRFNN